MLVLIVTSINTVTVSLFLFRKIVLYHCHLCWLLICSFLYVFSLYMSVTTRFDHWLHRKYISGRLYYLYKYHVGFSHNNGLISPSPLLIFILLPFFIVPSPQMSRSTYWDNWLYRKYSDQQSYWRYWSCFSSPITTALYHIHRLWLLLYVIFFCLIPRDERDCLVSFIFICFFFTYEWDHSLWSLITSEVLWRAIVLPLYTLNGSTKLCHIMFYFI